MLRPIGADIGTTRGWRAGREGVGRARRGGGEARRPPLGCSGDPAYLDGGPCRRPARRARAAPVRLWRLGELHRVLGGPVGVVRRQCRRLRPGVAPGRGGASSAPFATSDCATLNPPTDADTAPGGGTTVDAVTVTETAKKVPLVTIAKDAAPATSLVVKDLVVGTGAEAKATSTVSANYCGVGQATRAIFDSSWARGGQPLTFPLNQVIAGWQQGIPGMKVGGRRLLIIPGELAYGANPPSPDILPNETLVFVVDLTAVS